VILGQPAPRGARWAHQFLVQGISRNNEARAVSGWIQGDAVDGIFAVRRQVGDAGDLVDAEVIAMRPTETCSGPPAGFRDSGSTRMRMNRCLKNQGLT